MDNKILDHIQILRGYAVLIVFLYHTNIEIFKNGYLGVDIFFVISGFVITKRLIEDFKKNNNIRLSIFYINRVKRILPNLVFIVSITYIFYLLFGPSDFSLFNETTFALLGISNLYYINHSKDYFENIFVDPLGHTWSLGIEEQFYLFFPIIILVTLKFISNKIFFLKIIIFSCLILSLLFFVVTFNENKQFAFYFSPFRFWEFLFGSVFYFANNKIKKNNEVFIFSILILIIIFLFSNNINYILKNFFTCLFTGLYISTYSNSKFFVQSKLVFFGNISYSFYLWHLPIIFFADLYITHIYHFDVFFSFLFTIFLSYLTYKFIEQKFRYKEFKISQIKTKFIGAFLIFFTIYIGYIKYYNNNLRLEIRNFLHNINYPNIKHDWNKRVNLKKSLNINGNLIYENCTEKSKKMDIKFYQNIKNSQNLNKVKFNKNCQVTTDNNVIFFLAGNSHMAHFIPIFNDNLKIKNFYYEHTFFNDIPLGMVNLISQKFKETYLVMNISHKNQLDKIIKQYKYLDSGIKLIIFNSTPHGQKNNEPSYIFKCVMQNIDCFLDKKIDYSVRSLDEMFNQIKFFTKLNKGKIFLFDSYNSFCREEEDFCKVYDKLKKVIYYRDRTHILPEIKNIIVPKFNSFLEENYIIN